MWYFKILAFGMGMLAFSANAATDCTEIRFAAGTSAVEISGEAPANDVACYTMRTGAGQQARIQVLEGNNTIVTVIGLAEARQDIAFVTEAKEYRLLVGQLMRALQPQAFRMRISVE